MKFYFPADFFVRFAETDAAGVVHFSHFLRWAENAEGDFFRKNALPLLEKTPAGTLCGWPRAAVNANFRVPARYADRIRVGIRPAQIPNASARSIEWNFEIFRIEKDEGKTLLAQGSWTSVYAEIAAGGKIRTAKCLPESVLNALKSTF